MFLAGKTLFVTGASRASARHRAQGRP